MKRILSRVVRVQKVKQMRTRLKGLDLLFDFEVHRPSGSNLRLPAKEASGFLLSGTGQAKFHSNLGILLLVKLILGFMVKHIRLELEENLSLESRLAS
ncbi:unnamed protein product [Cuscuta campestris]|uniref:Uncharacterized protein n=1 Tax=Cuscuta campestris TaxID=132261 RepID=A0A484N0U1_9ASTE|nr:unnamed protein product [Cuscuta campestris]